MRFESPLYFLFLLPALLVAVAWFLKHRATTKKINKLFSVENQKNLNLSNKDREPWLWGARSLFMLAFVFLVVALARPQQGQKQKSMLVSEHSVVFLVDVSRSMLTKDSAPSRLELLKQEIYGALDVMADIRVGLVAFAGSVDVVSPMTSDLSAIRSYVESLDVDSISSQGTNIFKALQESEGVFERSIGDEKDQAKIIVLFSDGENHQEKSLDYVKNLYEKGYRIFTVGVGTKSGGYVPQGDGVQSYIKDQSGQPVISKPNFGFLKDLAKKGGGSFYYLSPINPLAAKLKKGISQIEGVAASRRKFVVRNEIYQIFICLALVLFVVGMGLRRVGGKK